jgi:hypothetical protein
MLYISDYTDLVKAYQYKVSASKYWVTKKAICNLGQIQFISETVLIWRVVKEGYIIFIKQECIVAKVDNLVLQCTIMFKIACSLAILI